MLKGLEKPEDKKALIKRLIQQRFYLVSMKSLPPHLASIMSFQAAKSTQKSFVRLGKKQNRFYGQFRRGRVVALFLKEQAGISHFHLSYLCVDWNCWLTSYLFALLWPQSGNLLLQLSVGEIKPCFILFINWQERIRTRVGKNLIQKRFLEKLQGGEKTFLKSWKER